jgi:hypothetical protein
MSVGGHIISGKRLTPSTIVKCNQERNVRSFAKETFGSTLTGRAMRFAAVRWRSGCVDMLGLLDK